MLMQRAASAPNSERMREAKKKCIGYSEEIVSELGAGGPYNLIREVQMLPKKLPMRTPTSPNQPQRPA